MTGSSEGHRQLVHIGVGGFALLLRFLSWWQAAGLAALAALFNLTALPRIAPRLFRPGDGPVPARSGIVVYPLSVLGLVLCFPRRPDIVASAWAILAAGDGAATLAGTRLPIARLPWNREKSVGGLAAFVACGALAGMGLAVWTHPATGAAAGWWLLVAPAVAALIAGLIETAPIRLDDNISVPAAAALTLWSLTWIDATALAASLPDAVDRIGPAVLLNAAVALAGWRAGTVTVPGAIVGAAIGIAVFTGAGWAGWTMLLGAFLAAAVTTRAGLHRKTRQGIAEPGQGRRGPANAVANTSIAAWAALISLGMASPDTAWIAMVAALVTGAADTVASEIGKAWGRSTWLITGFRRVPPGTSGAVSMEGTAALVLAAAGLAGVAAWLGLVPAGAVPVIAAAAVLASLVEGALGATLEAPGILDNDALNFVSTALGAGLAVFVWSLR